MQTPRGEFEKRQRDIEAKISEIEHDYHQTRKVLKLTIELANTYMRQGRAESAILPSLDHHMAIDDIVESSSFPVIRMEPVVTGSDIQNVWNIWSEAESVAHRSIAAQGRK